MRDIKFRVMNTDTGNWEYIEFKDIPLLSWRDFDTKMEHWSQYTGLKDKHSKEIYEGDIMQCETLANKTYNEEVIYEHGSFWVGKLPMSARHYKECLISYEVIGNIYENPELLKSSNQQTANNKNSSRNRMVV